MKSNELIEKILNKEIKSGTLLKMEVKYPTGLNFEEIIRFNGNWFSDIKHNKVNDMVCYLCCKYAIFNIVDSQEELQERIDKSIEILKLCNSKCSKEVINILKGEE